MQFTRSEELFDEASKYLVGGVNSPVRAFKSVGGKPLFIKSAKGSKLYDEDGNELVDYIGSWGPFILGHSHPKVTAALIEALELSTSYGAPSVRETELAKLVQLAFPSMELVRFVSSGTEAVMGAIRVARGFTGRNMLVKFSGGYHGHSDFLLAEAGSGLATLGMPGSAGVPEGAVKDTLVIPYNDVNALEATFKKYPHHIAAIIVEPIAGNMGVVVPPIEYLRHLREITTRYGALLIFDEVMTGFRFCFGGVQNLTGVHPDLTTIGKIIGGGLPVGAYGGRKEIMEKVAPLGPVYQAGTLSGNALAMTAGIATLTELQHHPPYKELEAKGVLLEDGLLNAAEEAGIDVRVNRYGSMLTVFFTAEEVKDYQTAKTSNVDRYSRFFWGMMQHGIYLPPSQFEAWFISSAHNDEDIQKTISAAYKVLQSL